MSDLWVFGYGSLMWRPGFAYEEAVPAVLQGAHRALCLYSVVHRGTPSRPGLVLGLDVGGNCRGIAFRVCARDERRVRDYLRRREQVTNVYRAALKRVELPGRAETSVRALCFVVDRCHPQYAGRLPIEVQAWLVRRGQGRSGANIDYVVNTVRHLVEMGIEDRPLLRLMTLLGGRRRLG